MVTDAQFLAWLKRSARRTLLAEIGFAYESAGNIAQGTVYVANRKYITNAGESPANQPYRESIIGTPTFWRRVSAAALGGMSEISVSDLKLANADGSLDFMLNLVLDGQEVRFYLGDEDWDRSDFRLVLVAVAERVVASNEMEIHVKLRDKRLLIDKEIKGNPVGGAGPNASQFAPVLWGYVENIDLTPFLYDAATFKYQVLSNFGASVNGIFRLRDNGAPLEYPNETWTAATTTVNAGTGVITRVAHGVQLNDVLSPNSQVFSQYAYKLFPYTATAQQVWVNSVPTPDTFTCSLTKGGATLTYTATTFNPSFAGADLIMRRQRYFDSTWVDGQVTLASKPDGRVTADVMSFQPFTDGVNPSWPALPTDPFNFAGGLLMQYGGVYSAIDQTSMNAADAALDVKVALGLGSLYVRDRKNLMQVVTKWLDDVFGFFGQSHLGAIIFGMVDPSGLSAKSATRTLSSDIDAISEFSVENLPPTISRVNVGYEVNQTVQPVEGLVTSLTDEEKSRYGKEFESLGIGCNEIQRSTAPSGTTYAANKPLYHKTMTEGAPRAIEFQSSWPGIVPTYPIGDYANEVVSDRLPNLQVVRASAGLDKYNWALGDVVLVTHNRFGLDAGKKCCLIGVGVDLIGEAVNLELLTQTTPNTTTGSYN